MLMIKRPRWNSFICRQKLPLCAKRDVKSSNNTKNVAMAFRYNFDLAHLFAYFFRHCFAALVRSRHRQMYSAMNKNSDTSSIWVCFPFEIYLFACRPHCISVCLCVFSHSVNLCVQQCLFDTCIFLFFVSLCVYILRHSSTVHPSENFRMCSFSPYSSMRSSLFVVRPVRPWSALLISLCVYVEKKENVVLSQ